MMILLCGTVANKGVRKAKELALTTHNKVQLKGLEDITKSDIRQLLIMSNEVKDVVVRTSIDKVQDLTVSELIDYLYTHKLSIRVPQLFVNGKLISGWNEEKYVKYFLKRKYLS